MLSEARIVMPHFNTALSDATHNTLRRQLAASFGGFTCFRGEGGWVDPDGNLIHDDVTIYDIAIDADRDAPFELLHRFAVEAGRALEQDSVYIRYPNNIVEIAKVEPAVAVDAGKQQRLLDALARQHAETGDIFGIGGGVVADMGDGRSAAELPMPRPGELWENRAGDHVFVGKRCTIAGGGWYATEVRSGFEYVVDLNGRLMPHIGEQSYRDLVKQVH